MPAKSIGSSAKRKAKSAKPEKPRPDFPLFPHASKRWAKKIRGQFFYYGSWEAGPDAALAEYLRVKDYDFAGRPRPAKDGSTKGTVKFIVDSFLTGKERKKDAGEIVQRTFDEFFAAGVIVADAFGRGRQVSDLTPDDFGALRAQLAKRLGPTPLTNHIVRIRSIFKHAYANGLIDRPVRFGDQFSKPSAKTLKRHRAARGRLDFTAEEIRPILHAADVHLKAMILLGINAAFGNNDCGMLPRSAVDLDGGWIEFPRTKTGEPRRAKLWPETVAALKASLAKRPTPKNPADADRFFINKAGRTVEGVEGKNNIARVFLVAAKNAGKYQAGRTFYSLRRTFRTIAGQTLDEMACDYIMGHGAIDTDMGRRYTQHIGDDRLERVAEHVRAWLFPKNAERSHQGNSPSQTR